MTQYIYLFKIGNRLRHVLRIPCSTWGLPFLQFQQLFGGELSYGLLSLWVDFCRCNIKRSVIICGLCVVYIIFHYIQNSIRTQQLFAKCGAINLCKLFGKGTLQTQPIATYTYPHIKFEWVSKSQEFTTSGSFISV